MNRILIVTFMVLVGGAYLYFGHLKGPPSRKMPDLTGVPLEQALEQLESFAPGKKTIVPAGSEGNVKGQEPAPNDIWTYGDEIVLYISSPIGPKIEFKPLLVELEGLIKKSPYVSGNVIVVSGTLMGTKNVRFSQLEFRVIEQLREHLSRAGIQIAEISREDWIFLKLPELGIPPLCQEKDKLLVLEVNVNPSDSAQDLLVNVWGYSFSEGQRQNTDIVASIPLDYSTNSQARLLYHETPPYLPIPIGTRQNPFRNVEELARVHVFEARSAFPAGEFAAIDVESLGSVPNKTTVLLSDAFTRHIDDHIGIVAAPKNFRRLVGRLDFEKIHEEFDFTKVASFERATTYILIDVMDVLPDSSLLKVSMKAFWLSDPQAGTKVRGLKAVGYLQLAQEEFQSQRLESLSFQVNYVYRSSGVGKPQTITHGSILRSGDFYKIIFTPNRDCYVYIFQVDSSGQIFQLFPMKEFKGVTVDNYNPVKGGTIYTLPARDKSFKLDRQVGEERFYFTAFKQRNEGLEAIYRHLEGARTLRNETRAESVQAKLSRYFKKRGVESIETDQRINVTWQQSGDIFSIFGRRLEDLCEDCVHVIEFAHQ